jgi:hypothetical protein
MLEDPLGVDRLLYDVWRSFSSFRSALRAGRGAEHAFEHQGARVSRELVAELADNADDPLAPSLLRLAARLFEEHALCELDLAHAAGFRVVTHPLDQPERGHFTLAALFGSALANAKGQRAAYLDALFARGAAVTELALRRAERRTEVRESLARDVPADFDLPGPDVLAAAEGWLMETRDAFAALGTRSLADVFEVGLGRDSRASWPTRATPRALAELIREGRWLDQAAPDASQPTAAIGAASFLRAFYRLGSTLKTSLPARRGPFALAHDPFGLERATLGALFAGLPCGEAFARRELGVSPAASIDHRRTLARVLLVATREAALRVCLRAPSFAGTRALEQAYAERTHQALGVELPPAALGVLFTPRPADAQRFAGILLAVGLDARLRQEHDEDWYRNPRAVEEMREMARLPAPTRAEKEPLGAGAALLAKALLAAL